MADFLELSQHPQVAHYSSLVGKAGALIVFRIVRHLFVSIGRADLGFWMNLGCPF